MVKRTNKETQENTRTALRNQGDKESKAEKQSVNPMAERATEKNDEIINQHDPLAISNDENAKSKVNNKFGCQDHQGELMKKILLRLSNIEESINNETEEWKQRTLLIFDIKKQQEATYSTLDRLYQMIESRAKQESLCRRSTTAGEMPSLEHDKISSIYQPPK